MDRVLIVKWDCLYARFLSEAVQEFYPNVSTETAFTSEAALGCLAQHRYDLVIAGLSFSDGDGLPLIHSMASRLAFMDCCWSPCARMQRCWRCFGNSDASPSSTPCGMHRNDSHWLSRM